MCRWKILPSAFIINSESAIRFIVRNIKLIERQKGKKAESKKAEGKKAERQKGRKQKGGKQKAVFANG
jgi:hypothetical protein